MKKTLYIFQNGQLKRKDNSLYFETEERRKYIPIEDTSDIYIFGEVDVSKKFLEFVSQKEICIHYFNHYGYYVGTFYPREHLNAGYVVLKQAEHYLEKEKRLTLAKTFVKGSIGQMIQVLKYYRNRRDEGKDFFINIIEEIQNEAIHIENTNSIEELMAVEGHAREKYYSSFDYIIADPDFPFEKRSQRPPLNRLNAIISFGNTIVYTTVLSEIYKTYLDPRIGYLHATNFRRFSLNLDVAEIFKPIMIDRLIFTLINKKMITKKTLINIWMGFFFLKKEGKNLLLNWTNE
ncbi:type I-B CRISPR-associated endonuclease Cas1b [Tepidibacillus fermentans]|uniref:CRISPR-associated endonuclease Cas1 n=1 Tax=Tepidibacillus fermentans TaxID=1281767 RepID=A0A4R3K829_9BACI|nr:type I-B CRISPR-associated endonuclease Cas1b [Tepidibacillus fermentans]TCS78791.1 CRISPR-associated protein Cas1 [Tepidibacillus fermentans]